MIRISPIYSWRWVASVASVLFSCGVPSPGRAGEEISPPSAKAVSVSPEAVDPDPLDIIFYMPGWLENLDGTVGVKGLSTGIDVGFDDIVKNLDMIAAGGLEVRHGKFGFILEGIYADLSVGGTSPGPLLSTVSVSMEQLLAEGTLTYRIFESDRAWLELLAGARYIYLSTELSLAVDPGAVRDTSEALSAEVFDRATEAAKDEVAKRLPSLISEAETAAAALKPALVGDIERRVSARVDPVRDVIARQIDAGIGSSDPGLGAAIAGSKRVRTALTEYIGARVSSAAEAARTEVSAAVSRARKEAERRLAKAEANLAKALEKEINDSVPSSPVSGSKGWVDPFVGFRGQCRLSDRTYLAGRADIGGFGVSSDLMWNAYGALGVDISERLAVELGYRYLSVDYQSGGFAYDVATKGPFVGVRIEF